MQRRPRSTRWVLGYTVLVLLGLAVAVALFGVPTVAAVVVQCGAPY